MSSLILRTAYAAELNLLAREVICRNHDSLLSKVTPKQTALLTFLPLKYNFYPFCQMLVKLAWNVVSTDEMQLHELV